jgi:hypothetical protein
MFEPSERVRDTKLAKHQKANDLRLAQNSNAQEPLLEHSLHAHS